MNPNTGKRSSEPDIKRTIIDGLIFFYTGTTSESEEWPQNNGFKRGYNPSSSMDKEEMNRLKQSALVKGYTVEQPPAAPESAQGAE
jgi:hypothetical protein